MTGHQHTNHLALEKSPYLQQHAHNPIDWYPWGKVAFELAKSQDKPIFLSIGYATCHWCHVMERESFESDEVAKVLNEVFVNIKVDREELPEVDSLYMELSQALMSTAGGWPLNVILTPDLKPFFAVTYLPAKTNKGLIGLTEFAKQIQMIWLSEERSQIVEQADKVVELFEEGSPTKGSEMPTSDVLGLCVEELFEVVDPVYGGMKGEPKFPISYACDFMFAFSKLKGDSRSLFFGDLTLDRMYRGGLYDQIGGGFSRYAIDAMWQLPHFEKTLVDNAILARSYLQGWRCRKNPVYERVCRETLDYILDHLSQKEGGLCSAEDADFEGKEGLYYTWTTQEIEEVLGAKEGELFCNYFGVTAVGNFEGRNVLHVNLPVAEFADALSKPAEEIQKELDSSCAQLKKKRDERLRPFVDDKVVSSSNGFAIATLALAGRAFQEPRYVEAAQKAVSFLQMNLVKEGQLFRRFRDNEVGFAAGLDDYAAVIKAALTLFETGYGTEYLRWAIEMTDFVRREFKEKEGAFFQTPVTEEILMRKCDFYDGAEPSANAVHTENLVKLFQMTGEEKYLAQAEDVFKAVNEFMQMFPPGACYHLLAFLRYLDRKAPSCVIALNENRDLEKELMAELFSRDLPNGIVVWKRFGDSLIDKLLPVHADKVAVEGKTTLYLCTQEACESPLYEREEMIERIKKL